MKHQLLPYLFLISSIFFSIGNTTAQIFDWAKKIGGIRNDYSNSIVVDNSGNVYTTGLFRDNVDFDPGPGTFTLSAPSNSWNIFVSKLDASGNFIWAKKMGGANGGHGKSIVVDTSGNVYITGYFSGTVDFDPDTGIFNLSSAGNWDIFISKLDSSGNFIWAKKIGSGGADYSYSIAVDHTGNVYTTGSFVGTVDFNPGAATYNLSAANYGIFVSKLDTSGNFIWAKKMAGIYGDIGFSIEIDPSGNVYTTGQFTGTVDFDPGPATFNLRAAGGRVDIFVSKLDAGGNFRWAKNMGGGGLDYDYGYSIVADNSGNVYTTGLFVDTADFDPGPAINKLNSAGGNDIFISKLDSLGNFIWAKSMGGTGNEEGKSIAVDSDGNVYTIGNFSGTVDFDPDTGSFLLSSSGSFDIFVSKLDSSGNFRWAEKIGGANTDRGLSIELDPSGNIYTTGYFSGTVDFDPGSTTFNLSSAGFFDIFISKLNPCVNSASTQSLTTCDSYIWLDSITYTSNTSTPTFTFINSYGCDSVVTLDLTIIKSNTGADTIIACNSFTWIDSLTYTASTNTPTFTLSNVFGCDSIVSLNLTVNNSNTGTDTIVACDSFTWIDSVTYASSTNTPSYTLSNVYGCDSVVTLNLTINYSNYGTDVIYACDSFYTWIDSITYTSNTNTPTYTLTNSLGCDSIVNLNLTINNSNTGTDVVTACTSFTWIDNNTYTSSTNSPTFILSNASACDSIVTLNLTINTIDTSITKISDSLFSDQQGATYQWLNCDSNLMAISGATDSLFCPKENGFYACEITLNNCVDTSACIQVIFTGVAENLQQYGLTIYPNPVGDVFNLELKQATQNTSVSIRDAKGQVVYTKTKLQKGKTQIDASKWAKGIYFVQISSEEFNKAVKIVRN